MPLCNLLSLFFQLTNGRHTDKFLPLSQRVVLLQQSHWSTNCKEHASLTSHHENGNQFKCTRASGVWQYICEEEFNSIAGEPSTKRTSQWDRTAAKQVQRKNTVLCKAQETVVLCGISTRDWGVFHAKHKIIIKSIAFFCA